MSNSDPIFQPGDRVIRIAEACSDGFMANTTKYPYGTVFYVATCWFYYDVGFWSWRAVGISGPPVGTRNFRRVSEAGHPAVATSIAEPVIQ